MNKKLRALITSAAVGAVGLLTLAQPAFAQRWPWEGQTILSLARIIIQWIMGLGAIIAVGVLVMGGIKYMSSGGDKMKVQEAQGTMTAAIVGLIVCLGAYVAIYTFCTVLSPGSGFCELTGTGTPPASTRPPASGD